MSNHLAIAAVTATLGQLVRNAIRDEPNSTVTTVRPDGKNGALPPRGVNIFLYQVAPNNQLNIDELPMRSSDGRLVRRPRIALDLNYLLTFYGDDTSLEPQRLLGRLAPVLHSRPVLTRQMVHDTVNDAAFQYLASSDLEQDVELVKMVPITFSLEELTKLWSVLLQTPYNLSVAYQGTAVMVQTDEAPADTLPVRERRLIGVALAPPEIERINPQTVAYSRTARITIAGRNLGSDNVRVRFGGAEIVPQLVTEDRIVTSLPADARAGFNAVTVAHLGTPELPLPVESNPLVLVVQPAIGTPAAATFTGADGKPYRRVTVDATPAIGVRQSAELSLTPLPPAGAGLREIIVPAMPRTEPATTVVFEFLASLAPNGAYLARVRVDGVASPLVPDSTPGSPTFGQYQNPQVSLT